MAVYVVGSNFFIEAHRAPYPLDIATGFWNKVQQLANTGSIISIDKVKKELYDKNDALEVWCRKTLPETFFQDTSEVVAEYGKVSVWAISMKHHYLERAVGEFLDADEADAFLIAYSLADAANRFIVTQEVANPQRRNKIKIPDCCTSLNVRYMTTIEMFRELDETFQQPAYSGLNVVSTLREFVGIKVQLNIFIACSSMFVSKNGHSSATNK